ncbi:carboxylesterase/lipase family protein [Brevibacterium sp. UCMA 11754]|uniref:carboxylesterase/lipase family protein n=1 Tax=Brevibacterium sp. UCMA 11754 TaxID=2749198 RepID=UPI001F4633DE|nr:carboxylesterase/lipase family protein [Brevibacterium sp. UCMA 11754]MCF2573895.1 carboxylesterase/lipase family protein [Brevibacterium sp. UCMA 11754]
MSSTVSTAFGDLRGTDHDGITSFLGVPYAAPLTTANRLRPPQAPQPWTGIRTADRYGPTATQNSYAPPYSDLFVEPKIDGAEQLNVNIWSPDSSGQAPVLVWIHGGAFAHGAGSLPQYDGSSFARNGVVCVTINYRLGIEGFLDLGDDDANIGLRDQIAALSWVRDNIAVFGGDPNRVTVAGQSAGAMSIGALLSSPSATGLFHGAILQSGACHQTISRDTAKVVGAHLAEQLEISADRESFAQVDSDRSLAELATLETSLQTAPDFAKFREAAANMMPMSPSIDGNVIPQPPLDAVSQGSAEKVPLLIGTNLDENMLFLSPSGAIDAIDEDTLRASIAGYGITDVESALELYTVDADRRPGRTLAALATDWMFRIPAARLAEAQHQAHGGPTFMYEFAWQSRALDGCLAACHSVEIPFVFNTLDEDGSDLLTGPAPQELADEVHQAWIAFIRDGAPGWRPYSPDDRAVQRFNTSTQTITDPRSESRKLWNGIR